MSIELITRKEANDWYPAQGEGGDPFPSDLIVFEGEDATLAREAFINHASQINNSPGWNTTVREIRESNFHQDRSERHSGGILKGIRNKIHNSRWPLLGRNGLVKVDTFIIDALPDGQSGAEAPAGDTVAEVPEQISEAKVTIDSLDALRKAQGDRDESEREKAKKIRTLSRNLYQIAFTDKTAA